MAKQSDIDWKPILICGGIGITCLIAGVMLAPQWQKFQAKRKAKQQAKLKPLTKR